MKNSKIFSAVFVAALLFANIACACAPSDASAEPPAHHHTTNQDDPENTPGPQQDCDGCDQLLDRCTSADYSLALVDRDARTLPPQRMDLDGPDPDQASDTGQAWGSLRAYGGSQPRLTRVAWVADTPILRKDQLTE